MQIEVILPGLLRDLIGGKKEVHLEAVTLEEALERLYTDYPLLQVHLCEESGRLRPHVRIFYNAESLAWLKRLDIPLQEGDCLQIVQAVSGG